MASSWNDIIGALMDGARSANPAGQGGPSNISGGLLQNFGAPPLNAPSQPGWPPPSLASSQTPYGAVLQNIIGAMPQTRSGAMPDAIVRPSYQGAMAMWPAAFMPPAGPSSFSDFASRGMGPVASAPVPLAGSPGSDGPMLRYASSNMSTASPSQPAGPPNSAPVNHNIASRNSISPDKSLSWSPDNGKTVNILHPDNSLETRTGGSLSWRSNSPGNVTQASAVETKGGYGVPLTDEKGKHYIQRHAVFDSAQTGADSLRRQFFAPNSIYAGLTIDQALNKFAPSNANNNTAAYINDLTQRVGLDRNAMLNTFTPLQQTNWLNGVQRHEGWAPGSVKWE